MNISISFGGLKLKVSFELSLKSVYVREYSRKINGRQVIVRAHYRRR